MPDDQTTRKLQHREIRVGALFPADQQTSITIEPAVRVRRPSAAPARLLAWSCAHRVVRQQSVMPEALEDTRVGPLPKPSMRRRMRTQDGGIERGPLHPGAQQQQDRIHGDPIRNAGSVAAQRMGFGRRINGAIRAHIASLMRQPSSCCELIASPSEQRIPFVGQARTQLFQPAGTGSKNPH